MIQAEKIESRTMKSRLCFLSMLYRQKSILSLVLIFSFAISTQDIKAKVELPSLLSSGMIVQRGEPVRLWGVADPGETVVVSAVCWENGVEASIGEENVIADYNGKWAVELPALKAGGPYEITVNDVTLKNILSGDVFLCSGQSNMELPVRRVMDRFADEIEAYSSDVIREFRVPSETEFHEPRENFNGGSWKPATIGNVMEFSALGYFIAKSLDSRSGVPVGIINASWGGTPIEAWMSEESLAPISPRAINEKRIYENDAYREHIKTLEKENHIRWNEALYRGDAGINGAIKWYNTEFDDSKWNGVDILSDTMPSWSNDGLNPVNGSHWFRKNITLSEAQAKESAVLRLGCMVDADSVYVNGVFVGSTSYQYPPRIYSIPEGVLKDGENNITIRLFSHCDGPRFVKEKPYKLIVGRDSINLDGRWRYHLGAPMPPAPDMEFYCYKPTVLYNAMIHPLASLKLAGVVWYQGESNVSRRNEYRRLLEAMIKDWRDLFGNNDLPFYVVELADFLHPNDKEGRKAWAEMRMAQAEAAQALSGVVLIRNSDLGEWNDIHPLDKKTLATRVVDEIVLRMR